MTSNRGEPIKEGQLASAVLMIRPVAFVSNPMTAASNRFQAEVGLSAAEQQSAAVAEFETLRDVLTTNGIRVVEIVDTLDPPKPDAVFPNNWVSFHADGRAVLYPMEAPNRRTERRGDILDALASTYGFRVTEVIDLSHHEALGRYLEGTGSMVLDRVNRVAYACLSSRTHMDVLGEFAQRLDYEVVAFNAVDRSGSAIYHTNVLMNVGESLAVICDEAVADHEQRMAVLTALKNSGHELVLLTRMQMESFAGNMLQLRSSEGEPLIVMSAAARSSLSEDQRSTIEKHARIISADISRIEQSSGGSVRCMLAEIHLPLA